MLTVGDPFMRKWEESPESDSVYVTRCTSPFVSNSVAVLADCCNLPLPFSPISLLWFWIEGYLPLSAPFVFARDHILRISGSTRTLTGYTLLSREHVFGGEAHLVVVSVMGRSEIYLTLPIFIVMCVWWQVFDTICTAYSPIWFPVIRPGTWEQVPPTLV